MKINVLLRIQFYGFIEIRLVMDYLVLLLMEIIILNYVNVNVLNLVLMDSGGELNLVGRIKDFVYQLFL